MSFQDPPRRQRPPRYQALAPHEDDPFGSAGLAGTSRQGAPWDDPQERSLWDSGAQQSAQGTGRSLWDTGSQQGLRDSGRLQGLRNSGGLRGLRDTGGQPSPWDTGAQPSPWDTGGQPSLWDTGAQRRLRTTGGQLPTRTTGAHRRASGASPQETSLGLLAGLGGRQAGQPRRRGLLPGALTGFLAAAVALGVANLIAAFVRPQASPIIAVGEAFIDRTPPALKNFAVEKFGENDKNMLLLGMYVTIALIAIAIGMLAWRRLWIGVGGIGLFGLFGAFVAITRPESHVTDVIPSIIGGIAGIAAIVALVQAGRPLGRASAAPARARESALAGEEARYGQA